MPVCYITLSEKVPCLSKEQLTQVRKYIAEGLNSKARRLDETHIAVRVQQGIRECMLGDIEIDIFSQFYFRRFFTRDKRANVISKNLSDYMNCCCATWINMGHVGYSRVCESGSMYFSDADNCFMRWIQKMRGISTSIKSDTSDQ